MEEVVAIRPRVQAGGGKRRFVYNLALRIFIEA